jgi:hypothetical protein
VTPEAAVYLQAVAGVSNARTAWEHSQHMGRDGRARFFEAARALRKAFPKEEADEQIAKLVAKLERAQ